MNNNLNINLENTVVNPEVVNENTKVEGNEIEHETTLYAEPIVHVGAPNAGFDITNALISSWITVFIIIIISVLIRMKLKKIPGKFQNMFEIILNGALDLADQVTGSRRITNKVFPLTISIFFFILINNWLGILPLGGFGIVTPNHEGVLAFSPFIRSGTADINTTVALAVVAVIGSNLFGIFAIGLWKVFNKYVNLKSLAKVPKTVMKDWTILLVAPVNFFVGILELIGEFAKVASLSFRLFGNVFAGEVLLMSMAALFAYILPVPFMFLEIFVGAIQALIFSMLTLVYFTIAAQDHDEHDEENHNHESVNENKEVILQV